MNKNNINFHSYKIKAFSEKVFNLLDTRLDPKTYVLVINNNGEGEASDFYMEPEVDCGDYLSCYGKLKDIILSSHLNVKDIFSEFEIHSVIKDFFIDYDRLNKTNSFVSNIYSEKDLFILIVLQVDGVRYNSYPRLKNIEISMTMDSVSMLNFVIERFLSLSLNYFIQQFHVLNSVVEAYDMEKQIITWAANVLMNTVDRKASSQKLESSPIISSDHRLFDNCNIISSLMYEGRECKAKIIISPENHPNLRVLQSLKEPVSIESHRSVRKLMEISLKENYLLYSEGFIYGIGALTGDYKSEEENLFYIYFNSHYKWVLSHGSDQLMSVSYGYAKLYDDVIDFDMARIKLKKVFSHLENNQIERLLNYIENVSRQKHGTILVILENAEEEALRLKNHAIVFKPFKLDIGNLMNITNIDGAVILDTDLNCYAAGVILDGIARLTGTASRGARYNSALRYIESQEKSALAVVVSEDGMVDLVCN